ncbi:response regulator transcription factor [Nostocoides veronense]|uniref:Response regulator transcription factor n=1 Tax=Nostocoides veronense TaxID=330836 RepID=A0ABN2LKA4_9MICO
MTETDTAPIRLILVDDQELVRAGFRMVLDAQPDMTVVGEAGDGQEAVSLVRRTRADVVLMDIRMPRMDGVQATEAICATTGSGTEPGSGPRIVVLTTFDLDEYAFAALRAGAAGFLLKDAGPAELLSAIRAVHRGDSVIAPSTTRRLLEHVAGNLPGRPQAPAATARLDVLTPREIEVLTAVGQGLSNAEICQTLFMAEGTVKTHIGRILHKLDLRDRVHMVMLAYETGLVRVGPGS